MLAWEFKRRDATRWFGVAGLRGLKGGLPKAEISDFKFQISEYTAETNDIGSEDEFGHFGNTP